MYSEHYSLFLSFFFFNIPFTLLGAATGQMLKAPNLESCFSTWCFMEWSCSDVSPDQKQLRRSRFSVPGPGERCPINASLFCFSSQICRLQRHLSAGEHQQDLFQSLPAIFVSQHSQPPTQSLVELIQLCGGTVCKTVRQAGICIGRYSGRRPEGSRILSEQWVLGERFPLWSFRSILNCSVSPWL